MLVTVMPVAHRAALDCMPPQSQHNSRHCAAQGPVPWEEIEKMSLATPRSWLDDEGSDVSDPASDDRVTIYTPELSPTPSEFGGALKSVRAPTPALLSVCSGGSDQCRASLQVFFVACFH